MAELVRKTEPVLYRRIDAAYQQKDPAPTCTLHLNGHTHDAQTTKHIQAAHCCACGRPKILSGAHRGQQAASSAPSPRKQLCLTLCAPVGDCSDLVPLTSRWQALLAHRGCPPRAHPLHLPHSQHLPLAALQLLCYHQHPAARTGALVPMPPWSLHAQVSMIGF